MIARNCVMIMAPCGTQFAGEMLGAELEKHLTINNLLLFWPSGMHCLCVCVFSWSPRRLVVGLFYGSSFHVKCLVQSGLAATAPLFHHSPTHTSGSPHGSESSGNYSSSYQETLLPDGGLCAPKANLFSDCNFQCVLSWYNHNFCYHNHKQSSACI